jgi:hypothetical protein
MTVLTHERLAPGVDGIGAQFFFDAHELIVFLDALATAQWQRPMQCVSGAVMAGDVGFRRAVSTWSLAGRVTDFLTPFNWRSSYTRELQF